MKNKVVIMLLLFLCLVSFNSKQDQYIARQGQVSFFSYTTAENIEAKNNQVLSILDLSKEEVAISMLMNAFVFKKSLMYEHFNESYIESDLYPKATFKGKIIDFDPQATKQTRMIKGVLNLRSIEKDLEVKTTIEKNNNTYTLIGEFKIEINDFKINIPTIVEPNIAKTISTKFIFEYEPYEK